MPTFKIARQEAHVWLPAERIVHMETAPGGLTTNVRALVVTPKGEALATFEVEGRCEGHGAELDARGK